MRPHFVVSTGRSGSTVLSEILSTHPAVLNLSECFLSLGPDPFPAGELTAGAFWDCLSRPRARMQLMLRHRMEPPEFLYPVDAGGRFDRLTGVPPLCAACLPFLFPDPDAAHEEIRQDVATFPTATAGAHYRRLFDGMAQRLGRSVWIERSGGSLTAVGGLIANFPTARFVHLHRDGPACATSMSRHNSFRLALLSTMLQRELGHDPYEHPDPSDWVKLSDELRPFLPDRFDADAFRAWDIPLERFGRWWSATVLSGTRRLTAVAETDVMHLSYDALVTDPAGELTRILRFLELGEPDAPWLTRAAARLHPVHPGPPPSAALIEACEAGARRLRRIAATHGPGHRAASGRLAAGTACPVPDSGGDQRGGAGVVHRARDRAVAGLPPGPDGGLASVLRRLFDGPETLLTECRDQLGDCFTLPMQGVRRHPRPVVVISDPAAVRELFEAGPALSTPVPSRHLMQASLGPESLFLLDDDAHLRRRRTLSPSLHGAELGRWRHLAEEIAEREVRAWFWDERLELGPRLSEMVLDITVGVTLGDCEPERLATLRGLAEEIRADPPPTPGRPGRGGGPTARQAFDAVLADELRARRRRPSGADSDVLAQLLAAGADGRALLSDAQLADELATLFLAGHETASVGLAWAFELLLRSPEALALARGDAIAGDGRYLSAVVREALRCKPPIPLVNRTLRRPWEVSGYRLPEGTDLAACIYLVHQRPDLYPEPSRFRPERFLTDTPPRFNWLPFGAGVRRCIGAAVAELEMAIVLRAVLSRGELELAEPGPLPHAVAPLSLVFRPHGVTPVVWRRRVTEAQAVSA